MKNLFFGILIAILAIPSITSAQLHEKDNLIGLSLGFWPNGSAPTFGLSYEGQITSLGSAASLGLGGLLRFTKFQENVSNGSYYNNTFTAVGFQTNINFNSIGDGKFVPFIGAVLGYNSISNTYVSRNGAVYSTSYPNSTTWFSGQGGMRYFFSPSVAGAVRFNFGNFNFNTVDLGVDFKF